MKIEEFEKMKEEAEAFISQSEERARAMLSDVQREMVTALDKFQFAYESLKADTECYFKKFRSRIEEVSATAFSSTKTKKEAEEKEKSETKSAELSEIKQMLASISARIEKIEGGKN